MSSTHSNLWRAGPFVGAMAMQFSVVAAKKTKSLSLTSIFLGIVQSVNSEQSQAQAEHATLGSKNDTVWCNLANGRIQHNSPGHEHCRSILLQRFNNKHGHTLNIISNTWMASKNCHVWAKHCDTHTHPIGFWVSADIFTQPQESGQPCHKLIFIVSSSGFGLVPWH